MTAEVTHACPPGNGMFMPCCGLTPFDASRSDRITLDPSLVTCGRENGRVSTGATLASIDAALEGWEHGTDAAEWHADGGPGDVGPADRPVLSQRPEDGPYPHWHVPGQCDRGTWKHPPRPAEWWYLAPNGYWFQACSPCMTVTSRIGEESPDLAPLMVVTIPAGASRAS